MQTIQLRDRDGCRKYLTPDERRRFRDAIPLLCHPIKEIYCRVIYLTGCRPSEAYRLRLQHFDLAEEMIVIESLKQRRRGVYRQFHVDVAWMRSSIELLSQHCKQHGKSNIWGFSEKTGYRAVKRVMAHADITGAHASPKGLRHAFGIYYAYLKTNPKLIQEWMGHASIQTTMIYLDAQGQEAKEAAKAGW